MWFRSGRSVIHDLDDDLYMKLKSKLRFVELFKDWLYVYYEVNFAATAMPCALPCVAVF